MALDLKVRNDFYPPSASEDFYPSMIEPIPILAWSCRPDGTAEFLNRSWLDNTGLALDVNEMISL